MLSVTPKQCLEARFVFKNDRMMLILTGLVLAVFAGSMVQYGDRIMAFMGGETVAATQDDSYSVRAGSTQILDVLSNDKVKGPLVVLTRPSCGSVELMSNNRLSFASTPSCNGAVEFAYCVDAEGACEPNAVKINVISVNFAQSETETSPATPEPTPPPAVPVKTATVSNPAATIPTPSPPVPANTLSVATNQAPTPPPSVVPIDKGAVASNQAPPTPAPTTDAPEIATFAVEMSAPTLATPSSSELISPSVAVASIRQSAGVLNNASTTDQNIATQNSASIGQTASVGPSTFAAPSIGESSNISLGGAERVVTALTPAPSGLSASSDGGNIIVQLERGPEAMASLTPVLPLSASSETAPLAANPERSSFAPTVVAVAQAPTPAPDTKFSAAPNAGGPIALVALSRTPSRGAGAGESLNVILTEPGLQSFAAPSTPPAALAPASGAPSTVSVMARGPNAQETLAPLGAPAQSEVLGMRIARYNDPALGRSPFQVPITPTSHDRFTLGAMVIASQPVLSAGPQKFTRHDTTSRFISVGRVIDGTGQVASIAPLSAPSATLLSKPAISLAPAAQPPVLEVSLPVVPQVPVITAPAQNSTCDIALSGRARSGANIQLEIVAACKPNQMVTVSHSGIAFSVLTDAQGTANVQLPAMDANAEILVQFADQSSASTTVAVADMGDVMRAGVSWQASMNLDLSAIEFGAAIGSEGYISPATPRDYRTSRIKGGGYLVQLGDPSLARGALAEVYTLPVARNQQRGTIALSIVISDPENVCGQTISAKTVRTRDGRNAGIRNVRFAVPACGSVSSQIQLPGAIDDIRLAGR